MATDFSGDFVNEFNKRFNLEYERRGMLNNMDDGMIKDWIIELLADNENLNKHAAELSKRLNVSAFNPRGDNP